MIQDRQEPYEGRNLQRVEYFLNLLVVLKYRKKFIYFTKFIGAENSLRIAQLF